MYSVIIPTMWKAKRLDKTLNELCEHPLVGQIILIDNSGGELGYEIIHPKIYHVIENENTYVTAAWNKGVRMAKYDKLLILNDDIWMDWKIFDILEPYVTEQTGLIGLDETEYNFEHDGHEFGLEPIEKRNGGWGCAIFVHKENYSPIPEEMKLWGQDDWLFVKARNRRKQNYKLVGYTIYGELSVTNNILDADPKIQEIRENDLRLKQQYNLF